MINFDVNQVKIVTGDSATYAMYNDVYYKINDSAKVVIMSLQNGCSTKEVASNYSVSEHDIDKLIETRDVFDFPKSTQTSTEVLSKICSDFEQILKGNNIGLWTLIADLHVSIQNTERLSQTKYVEETNYEENRFTEVHLGHDLFLYDSKYGIAYQACKYKKLKNKKEKVISAHIIL